MTMSDKPRFKPGELAWVNRNDCSFLPFKVNFFEKSEILTPGTACTIIRRALVKDYPSWHRRTSYEPGQSYAGLAASTAWMVLLEGEMWIVDECRLNKRLYTPRKGANKIEQ